MNKVKLPNKVDSKYLKKIRYEAEYYPFSPKYDKDLNRALCEQAVSDGVSKNVINIIRLSNYFNENFHEQLSVELAALLREIQLSKKDLRELFIGLINEQELTIASKFQEFLNTTKQLTAFDMSNATLIRKDNPDNPQNFTAFSETVVEFANTFFRYLSFDDDKNYIFSGSRKSENEIFVLLAKIFHTTNKYYGIKNHFDGSLFHNGEIEIISADKIYFNPCLDNLLLIEQACVTMIENQRLNRYEYYERNYKQNPQVKEWMLKDTSPLILDNILVENGFIAYTLRKRTLQDYTIHLDYLVSLHDYYSFYTKEILEKLGSLTIPKLLRLHTELHLIVHEVYKLGMPKNNDEIVEVFKRNFVPKINENTLKTYLKSVSNCNDQQIEFFLQTLTTNHSEKLNLYATHLLKEEDYYYFPLLPALKPNHFFLIDYWLETAGEDLTKRGKVLEKYVKAELALAVQKEYNKFNVIDQSDFSVNKKKQEIDLIIQTKNTLIVGEIKCVKYPMYERNYCSALTKVIAKAVQQVKDKSKFLEDNKEHFSKVYSLNERQIVKVIVLNFPVYCSLEVDDIPVVDINTFLSYFKSGKMITKALGANDIEIVGSTAYYTNENEFCNNFESYLRNNPVLEVFLSQLQITKSSYKVEGLPTIEFKDTNPISAESMMQE